MTEFRLILRLYRFEETRFNLMEPHSFFLSLLIILLGARIFGEIAVRAGMPSVIGEILAGILIGPSLMGWVEPDKVIQLLAEIGIILLLFDVGLETDARKLVDAGKQAFIVAIFGFIVPLILGFLVSRWVFDLPLLMSLFVGGTLTATSIGVTMRVLSDLKLRTAKEGQIVLGAAVIDDILGVIVLALLYEFSVQGSVSFANASRVLLFVAMFLVIAPLAAKSISLLIRKLHKNETIPGLIPTTIVSLVLFFAWLAHIIGAPELLGGFAAGLALSRRFFLPFGVALHADADFSRSIETEMRPIIQLFTPIFFVMVGLSLNLREIDWSSPFIWGFSAVFFAVAVVSKYAGVIFLKESWAMRGAIGMAMVPRGEVGLIFAELGRLTGVFNNEVHAGMVIVIMLTTLLAPLWMKFYYRRFSHYEHHS